MKKFFTAVLALLLSVSAMAGNNNSLPFVSFGVKAGFSGNQSKITSEMLQSVNSFKESASGFNAGIVARVDFPLLPIYVQGELLYEWGKYKNLQIANVVSAGKSANVTTNNFSVPVLLGVGIGSSNIVKIRANVGPVFNLVSTASIKDTDMGSVEDMFRRQTVTWTAGLGVDVFNIMVDVRYNGVFKKKEIVSIKDLGSFNSRPTGWTISVGYLF